MKYGKNYIGIDPGVKTGVAVYNSETGKLILRTLKLHEAFDQVLRFKNIFGVELVRIEDARLRKFFGNSGREVLQGAGSVKRDCVAWEDFLKDHGFDFQLLSPKQKGAKVSAEYFTKLTGFTDRCSQHARDAAMLVYKFK